MLQEQIYYYKITWISCIIQDSLYCCCNATDVLISLRPLKTYILLIIFFSQFILLNFIAGCPYWNWEKKFPFNASFMKNEIYINFTKDKTRNLTKWPLMDRCKLPTRGIPSATIDINSKKNNPEKTVDGQRFADNPRINDGLDGT